MRCLASIFSDEGKFRAKILATEALEPVDFFRQTTDRAEMVDWLNRGFVNITIVSQQHFHLELNHIEMFGCRSDDPSFELPIERIGHGDINETLPIERMSYDDIDKTLDLALANLDKMEKDLNAILPSPVVENEPELS